MRYISYLQNSNYSYGILNKNQEIIPMSILLKKMGRKYPEDLLSYIAMYSNSLTDEIAKIIPELLNEVIDLSDVKLISPIPRPRRNVFCVGKNYVDHATEISELINSNAELPKEPIYFSKVCDPAIGDQDSVEIRKDLATRLDYEAELVVIISKDGLDIKEEDVEDYIFGYAVGNDISARDLQSKRGQWFKGKSLDNAVIIGPYIADKSLISFPPELNITARVNGELRQNSNTKNFIFGISKIISDLSQGLTLRAGDLIMTGTPAGVGIAMEPRGTLNDKDIVECEIEGIGKITNEINIK